MTGRHIFEPFDILEAAQVQSFLQDQAVMRFATTADRFTQLTSPSEGMVTYVLEVGHHEWWDGTDWVPLGRTPSYQLLTFTTDDVFTKAQFPWASIARIRAVGGGGAGGGCVVTDGTVLSDPPDANADQLQSMGSGAGGGGYAESAVLLADMALSEPITVGAGGVGVTGAAGNPGGNSSFGAIVIGDGGAQGFTIPEAQAIPARSADGGTGGFENTGDIVATGAGGGSLVAFHASRTERCSGGWSLLSGRAPERSGTTIIGAVEGLLYGGGGSGSTNNPLVSTPQPGGDGAAGIVIVELYV